MPTFDLLFSVRDRLVAVWGDLFPSFETAIPMWLLSPFPTTSMKSPINMLSIVH